MSTKHFLLWLAMFLAVGGSLLAVSSASAQTTYTWDISGAGVITGGTGTWNTTNTNWTTDGGATNVSWVSAGAAPMNNAIIGGTAGTVTLGEAISLRNLTFTHTSGTYTITGSTLNFTGGTILASNPPSNANLATISSNITGAPALNVSPMDGNEQFTLNPVANGSMSIGTVTGSGGAGSEMLNLQGGTGSSGTIAGVSGGVKLVVTAGSWTLNGAATGYAHSVSGGTLTLNAALNGANRDVVVSGSGVLNYNVANAVAAANATTTSGDLGFRITGGSIDNTSGAAINTNASTTTGNWSNSWSFIGSNGANSDLNLGSGIVYLKSANTQVTVLNAATTLTVGGTIANDATAGRSLTKAGAGRLTVNGTNTYTGATTVNAGTLQIGNGGTTGSLSASSPITNNATLAFNRSNTITQGTNFASVIAGTGAVTKLGSGTLILNGTNTYAGATTISAGTLEVQGSVATSSSISNNASLVFNSGSAQNYANGISGTGTLTKNGIGTLTLDGTNTYTGATNVNAGTLRITGTGAINDSSGVTLNGGQFDYNSAAAMTAPLTFASGTLGGTNWTGSALNNLTIGTNHTISPGNSPGTAATVDQTWATGGTYRFEINSVAGSAGSDPGWDLLAGTGTLTITATSLNPFVIDLTSLDTSNNPNPVFNFDETQSYAWQIADFANPVAGFDASAFFVRATNFGNAYTGTFSVSPGTSVSGGDNTQLYVRYVAVPEPTTMAILGVGVAFLGRRIARSLAPRRSCPG